MQNNENTEFIEVEWSKRKFRFIHRLPLHDYTLESPFTNVCFSNNRTKEEKIFLGGERVLLTIYQETPLPTLRRSCQYFWDEM